MREFLVLLFDPALIGLNILIVLGAAMVWLLLPKDERTATKIARGVWTAALVFFAIWTFQQEHHVRLGSLVPTASQPTAVAFKGTTRYVSEIRAFFYSSGMWFLLAAGLICAGLERFLLRKRAEA
jgi:hypothetical protein